MYAEAQKTINKLISHIDEGFQRVTSTLCRKFQRLSLRYMDALKQGSSGMLSEWLVKKYSSHRSIPPGWERHVHEWIHEGKVDPDDLEETFKIKIDKWASENREDKPSTESSKKRKTILRNGNDIFVSTTLKNDVTTPAAAALKKSKTAKKSDVASLSTETKKSQTVSPPIFNVSKNIQKATQNSVLAVLKNSRGKYTSSYWLSSKNILSVFKAFDLTLHTTRSNSGRLAYNRTIIVEKGLSADLVVKTIMDRKNEFSDMDTDFGFAVVNTDSSTKSGHHWVIVVFQREHIDIKLCVCDPLDNTDACDQILVRPPMILLLMFVQLLFHGRMMAGDAAITVFMQL